MMVNKLNVVSAREVLEQEVYVTEYDEVTIFDVGSRCDDQYCFRDDYDFECYENSCYCNYDGLPCTYSVERITNGVRIRKRGVYATYVQLDEMETITDITLTKPKIIEEKNPEERILERYGSSKLIYRYTDYIAKSLDVYKMPLTDAVMELLKLPPKCFAEAMELLREVAGHNIVVVPAIYLSPNKQHSRFYVIHNSDLLESLGKPDVDAYGFREWYVDEVTLKEIEEKLQNIRLGEDDYVVKQTCHNPLFLLYFYVLGINNISIVIIEKAKDKFAVREHYPSVTSAPLDFLALVQWYNYVDGTWLNWWGKLIPPEVVEREKLVEKLALMTKEDYSKYRRYRNSILKKLWDEGVEPECIEEGRRLLKCWIPPGHIPIDLSPDKRSYSIPYLCLNDIIVTY